MSTSEAFPTVCPECNGSGFLGGTSCFQCDEEGELCSECGEAWSACEGECRLEGDELDGPDLDEDDES